MAAPVALVLPRTPRAKESHLYQLILQLTLNGNSDSWVGLPVSGLLVKLITMVTGRERSRLPTIFSHISFNGFKSPKREAPFRHRASATALLPRQLAGRVHTQWHFQYKTQSNLYYLTKATVKKQPSVRRLQHPSPPPPGGDALLRLPAVHVHHHRCQKRSATSWTRTFPGRPASARDLMESQQRFQD